MINYICKCDSAICTYKSASASFMYVKTGKKRKSQPKR